MIKNFTFQSPTKIIFGKKTIGALRGEIPNEKSVLLVYGKNSLKESGVLDQIKEALSSKKKVVEFSGIGSDPDYDYLIKGIELAKSEGIDYILAAGGGSVIDAAKFIAMAVLYQGDPWEIAESFGACAKEALPIATIVTLPASGSEVNRDAVISRASINAKLPMGNLNIYPVFSILDPELTFSLPKEQVANGILDIYAHVLEQYLTLPVNGKLQDRFAEGILLSLLEDGPIALNENDNYEAKSNIMLSAAMAMNGFLRAGVPMDWASHMISHEITVIRGLAHARALAYVIPAYLRYCKEAKKAKLLQYAKRVWNITNLADNEAVDVAISKTEDFFISLGFQTKLSELALTVKEIDKIIKLLNAHKMTRLGESRSITPTDVANILTSYISV